MTKTVDTRTVDERFGAAYQEAGAMFQRLAEDRDHYKTQCALKDVTQDQLRKELAVAENRNQQLQAKIVKLEQENAYLSEMLHGQPSGQSI